MRKIKLIKVIEYDEMENLETISELKVKNVNIIHFNQNGQEIQNDKIDKQGNISYSWINVYNDNGILIERHNNNSSKYKMDLNENGLKIAERFLYDDDEQSIRELEYDSKNNLVLEIFTNGAIQVKTYYDYDTNNNLKKKSLKQSNGICTTETHFKNGLLIHKNSYEPDFGKPTTETSYKYDKLNNIETITRKYSGESEILSTEKYEYIYDDNNNWIRQVETKNSGLLIVTNREIEYFD